MPYVIRRPRLGARLGALVSALIVASIALPAAAQADCPTAPVSKAFQPFGDSSDYSLLPSADFESDTSGWSLTGASVVAGNESFNIGGPADAKSLSVRPNGTVVSPAFCVGVEHPTFRFFARQNGGYAPKMIVKLRWNDASGTTHETTVGLLRGSAFASWAPTPPLLLAPALRLWRAGETLSVRLVLSATTYGGWLVDDVYIDPYAR
jgi:hypothetical protein